MSDLALPSPSSSPSASTDAVTAARVRRMALYLRRRWWIPCLCVVLCAGAQAAYSLLMPAGYTGVARMWVGGKVRLPESSFFSEEWQNFFGTQVELMQSEKIRRRALQHLKGLNLATNVHPLLVEVSQPRKTTIFNLSVRDAEAGYVEAYLNAIMEEYLSYKREVRASSSDDTVASLSEQLEKVERELQAEQDRLSWLQRSNSITVLQGTSLSAGNELQKLNIQLAELKLEAELLALVSPEENLEKHADASRPVPPPLTEAGLPSSAPGNDYLFVRQQRELKRLEQKELGESLRPDHPTMIKLKDDLARLDGLLAFYHQQSREQLEAARDTLRLKIKTVAAAAKEWEPRVIEVNQRLSEYERNKMNVERLQSRYDRLLQAKYNVDVNKSVDQESVSIMDRALVFPTPRRLPFRVTLAGGVGMILGLGLVLFLERADQRVHTTAEVRLGIPARLLGCIPDADPRGRSHKLAPITPEDQRHGFVESFRSLRSGLRSFRPDRRPPPVVLVTSAVAGEGKSIVALNLAHALAFAGAQVLLVDADLRRGRLHELLERKATPGLSDYVEASLPLDQVLQAAAPGVQFLSSGTPSDCPGEVLAQGRFEELLREARRRFDCIVIDACPVLAAADACTMAPETDGVLFVVRAGFTHLSQAQQALEVLRNHHATVLGTLFNRLPASSNDYAFNCYELRNGRANGAMTRPPMATGAAS